MPFNLLWPKPDDLADIGFAHLGNIPCFFDSMWTYHVEASQYIRARALCTFRPRGVVGYVYRMTRRSTRNFADYLINALEWCEYRKKDWRALDYENDVVAGYQADILTGRFSASGKGLSAVTVNLRVSELCNFLEWGAKSGHREEFNVPYVKKKVKVDTMRNSHGHRLKEVRSRVGRVRQPPGSLRMPKPQEIDTWLRSVEVQKKYTKYLMCKLIIKTGIRREEAVQWRIDTLPLERADWHVEGEYVTVKIERGTKGPKHVDENEEEVSTARHILLPLELAEEIHHYREVTRIKIFTTHIRRIRKTANSDVHKTEKSNRLFLSEFSGRPVSYQTLYEAWTEVSHQPFTGWSPHLGRHYWACDTLLTHVREQMTLMAAIINSGVPTDWAISEAKNIILLHITPQLGHINAETTLRYLKWVRLQLLYPENMTSYENRLEETL